MSQPPIYRSKPDRQPKLAVNRAPRATDEYLVDDSSSGDERPRAKPGYHVNDPTTSSAKRSGTKTVDHDDKVTVSGDYLKEMETMIRDLQRRVDACEHGSEPSSDSRMSSRRGSINSVPECDEEYIRDRRDPRSASDWKPRKGGSEAFVIPDGRYMPSPPAPPPFPPPAPLYPYVGVGSSPPLLPLGLPPVSQGCGPITVDGLPRLEIVRWKQCTTKYGEPEWHEDHKSPTATAAPKDFSQKSLPTVIRDYDGNKQFWRRRVHIVSPPVISLLKDLPCYDVHETSQDGEKDGELRLTEPMMILFHNRKHLQEKATTETRRVRDQLQFVLDFMRNEFSDVTRKLDDIESERPSGLVSYPELFLLYAPGTVVYSLENGEHDAFVVDSIRGMRKRQGGSYGRLDLTCWSINYDGEVFGRVWSVHKIPPFQGVKQINSLDLVPEGFLPKADGVKSDLISRGQKFWSLQGQRFLEYTGEIWSQHASEEAVRVMVDCLTYQRRNDWPISVNKKRGPDNAQSKNWQDNKFDSRDSWAFRSGRRRGRAHRSHSPRVIPYDDEYSPERDNGRKRHYSPYSRDRADRPAREYESEFDKYDSLESNSTPDELTLLLCPQHVQGYCLRDKVWKKLNVSQLQPVSFRKNGWDRLVLDEEYKDIVQAMVSSYVDKTAMLDDLVAGKGNGLVALLHGPPGSGKTLTAECVADSFEKPLYQVACGDIGTDPEGLEERLEEIFDYAVTWGAILLIDEADVFLQDRDYANMERNALVSIFLRTLEYFNGVLFLTTNRVGAFDQAFQSRIHVTLGLPSLDQQRRTSVWAIFLQDLAAKHVITDTHHKVLTKKVSEKWSKEKLNGRQIRNTARTALVIAEKKGVMVGEKEFETMLKIGREFEGYMGMLGKGEASAGLEGFQEV